MGYKIIYTIMYKYKCKRFFHTINQNSTFLVLVFGLLRGRAPQFGKHCINMFTMNFYSDLHFIIIQTENFIITFNNILLKFIFKIIILNIFSQLMSVISNMWVASLTGLEIVKRALAVFSNIILCNKKERKLN